MPATTLEATIRSSPVPLLRPSAADFRLDVAERRGELHRVRHGVYAPRSLWGKLAPWERYLARVHAYALTHPDAVFALESAAVLTGLPIIGEPAEIHVLNPDGTARLAGDVRTHVSQDEREIRRTDGIAFVAAPDTAIDIARARHPAVALAVADAVLRQHPPLEAGHLLELNALRRSARGRRAAMWPLSRATPKAETAIESISRAVIEWLGYEPPELQVEFRMPDGSISRVDTYWRGPDVIGEADGRVKYESGDPAVLWDEKRREDRLRRRRGGFGRWGWPEVGDPPALDAILRAASLRPVRPQQQGPLHSLPEALGLRRTPWPRA
ncbi:hypothetical protein [Microbacterium rhizophilus]|uniref:hypothetical protein n=1 Tax=Microbacterium rhizophilus TaxID=3138934 RepID=UPI0031E7A116